MLRKPQIYFAYVLLSIALTWLQMGCGPQLSRPISADAVPSHSAAPSAVSVRLSPIEIEPGDDHMKIVLSGSRPFTFAFENDDRPQRLMIDVTQAQVEQPETRQIARGGIQSVQLQPVPGTDNVARLTIHLEDRASYRLRKEPQRLVVRVQHSEPSGSLTVDRESDASSELIPGDEAPPSSPEAQLSQLVGSSQAAMPAEASGSPVLPEFQEYRVGAGDELAIDVYGEPELTQTYIVSERGNIAFQYVGSIAVAGLTTGEVTAVLKRALSPTYVLNPQVSVDVKTYKSQRVFVVGAISPATFTLEGDTTLIEILSQLQGLESNSHVLVYRRGLTNGKGSNASEGYGQDAIRVDLDRLLRQGDMSLNFSMQPRDVIFVPAAARQGGKLVFVVGAIRPQTFPLKEGMTLIEILSQLKDLETRTHILLYRRAYTDNRAANDTPSLDSEPIRVDLEQLLRQGDMRLNLVLEPRDVVYIPDAEQGGVVSNSITVFGEVKRPGPIEMPEGGMTIVDAIAEAGGFAQWAAPSRTRVLRMQEGEERTIVVNVNAIMRGKLSQNILLKPNDVIVVPERRLF